MNRPIRLACALGLAACASASAQTLQMDVNSMVGQALSPFGGLGYTGVVDLTSDLNSTLDGVLIDGSTQLVGATLSSFAGSLVYSGGIVTGGSFSVTMSDGTAYSASVVGSSGQIQVQIGQGFQGDGLTDNGAFNGPMFAGVNVSPWSGNQLAGSFLMTSFGPNGAGTDNDVDLEIFVEVPAPGTCALGIGAALLGWRRRRA